MSETQQKADATAPAQATQKKNLRPMAILGAIAAVGATIVALNTFTGLNFRPAWAYETENLGIVDAELMKKIEDTNNVLAASDVMIQQRLDAVLQIQDATSRTILELNKGQYGLKLDQIDRQKRELRRELAEHQSRAQVFRDRNEIVPGWLRSTIADTETTIEELNNERSRVAVQLLELNR
jgi:hypothetical protein